MCALGRGRVGASALIGTRIERITDLTNRSAKAAGSSLGVRAIAFFVGLSNLLSFPRRAPSHSRAIRQIRAGVRSIRVPQSDEVLHAGSPRVGASRRLAPSPISKYIHGLCCATTLVRWSGKRSMWTGTWSSMIPSGRRVIRDPQLQFTPPVGSLEPGPDATTGAVASPPLPLSRAVAASRTCPPPYPRMCTSCSSSRATK